MSHPYSEDQLIQRSSAEARDRLLPQTDEWKNTSVKKNIKQIK